MQSMYSRLVALTLVLVSTSSLAAEKELLDILLGNGAIDQVQYDTLLAKEVLEAEDVEEVVVKLDRKGLAVASGDGDFQFKIGTRLHFQASSHDGDLPEGVDATNGTELRRARIEIGGKLQGDYSFAAQADFADNKVAVKDFWLGYNGFEGTRLYVGHQKQPYSLSVEMSSNDIPFIERSIDNDLIIPFTDRALGLRVERSGANWFAAAGVFGEAVSPNKDDDEGWGGSARFVYSPVIEDNRIVHVGVRGAIRSPSASSNAFQIRDETTHQSNLRIVDTGSIDQVDKATMFGAEFGVVQDAFSLVGEYNSLTVKRNGTADLDFDSWHLYGTWSLTGESRAKGYKMSSGEFKRLTPKQDFKWGEGSWGAWEIAVRLAHLDTNDGAFTGGEETVLTSAINWYLNPNVRVMWEYSNIIDTDGSNELRDDAEGLSIFQFRTQYAF